MAVLLLALASSILQHIPVAGGQNLTCYQCDTTEEQSDCVTNASLSAIVRCAPEESFCVVLRMDLMGSFKSLERGCKDVCNPRCEVWGDEEDVDWCYNCCTEPLCNTGNTASIISPEVNVTFLIVVLTTIFSRVLPSRVIIPHSADTSVGS